MSPLSRPDYLFRGFPRSTNLIWMNTTDTLCGNTAEPSLPFDKFFRMDGGI
jgi:hypothetical protein